MLYITPKCVAESCLNNEKGLALISAILALLVVTVLGIIAINTSIIEVQISGNEQQWEEDFNLGEGGAEVEATHVGYARSGIGGFSWYEISDPSIFAQSLLPPQASYDPYNDITTGGSFPNDFDADNPNTWPHQNLMQDANDDKYDYAYLVTYLYPDAPPKGYSANDFSGYKFRINGEKQIVIELGGIKVGVKTGI
jgi:hypothetical protein